MLLHIGLWQFDADGETLYDQDNPCEFEGDLIGIAPGAGVDQVGRVRSEDDAAKGCYCRFANVQTLPDAAC